MTESTEKSPVAAVDDRLETAPLLSSNGKPIVLKLKKRKKKGKQKYRYSRGLRDVQKAEARLAKVSKKTARSISKGIVEYDKQRRKSAAKKRDGAVRDFIPNMGAAMSESLSQASGIPADIADMMNTKTSRRMLRGQLRMASDAIRLFTL